MSLVGLKLWSEEFVATFVKIFIKHDILIKACVNGWKGTKAEKLIRSGALYNLSREAGWDLEEPDMVKMCIKLRYHVLSQLRRLVKRCKAQGRPVERAILMAPNWLRTAETKLRLLPVAIKLESYSKLEKSPEVKSFTSKLLENAIQAVRDGQGIYDPEVVGDLGESYDIDDEWILYFWYRTCLNMHNHIIALCRAGDSPKSSFTTDWRLADLLLLHDLTFRIVTKDSLSHLGQLKGLLKLYKIIVKMNIEELARSKSPELIQAWMNVYATYSYSAANISLILLQRRWYELKLEARSQVLAYWRDKPAAEVPHPLLLSIVSNFRYLILEPFPSWTDLVRSGHIVEIKDTNRDLYTIALQKAQEECGRQASFCICTDNCNTGYDKEINVRYVNISVSDDDEPLRNNQKDISEGLGRSTKETNSGNEQETLAKDKDKDNVGEENKETECVSHKEIYTKDTIPKTAERPVELDIDILNTIDPTTAEVQLIFDSDSENEHDVANNINKITSVVNQDNDKNTIIDNNTIANDVMQTSEFQNNIASIEKDTTQSSVEENTSESSIGRRSTNEKKDGEDDLKEINAVAQTEKNINERNDKSLDVNVEEEASTIEMKTSNVSADPKLLMNTTIPLVRCDHTPSWKKHFRNYSINIRNVHIDNLLPLKNRHLKQIPKNCTTKNSVPKRFYSTQALINNPDFNVTLKSLSRRFYSNSNNRRLLKSCKPVTVDLERMYIPSALSKESTGDTKHRRIARKIELQNIEDVRKINRTILTAEVAPIPMDSSAKCYNMVSDASNNTSAASSGRASVVNSPGKKPKQYTDTKCNELVSCGDDLTKPSNSELKTLLTDLWTLADETSCDTAPKALKDQSILQEKMLSRSCRCAKVASTEDQADAVSNLRIKCHEQYIFEEEKLSMEIYKLLKKKSKVDDKSHKYKDGKKGKLVEDDVIQLFDDETEQIVGGETSRIFHNNDNDLTKVVDDRNIDKTHGDISDSDDDNIKLSIVVDSLKGKGKERGPKRKNNLEVEQEKDSYSVKSKRRKDKQNKNSLLKPVETCPDEYQEWLRQKSIGLKYFNIPMVPPVENTRKRYSDSQSASKFTNDSRQNEIIYENNNTDNDTDPSKLNRPLHDSREIPSIDMVCATIIDLTETPDETIEQVGVTNSNASLLNVELGSTATQTLAPNRSTPREIQEKASVETAHRIRNAINEAPPSNNGTAGGFAPIITGVCSLANTQSVEESNVGKRINPIETDTKRRIVIHPMLYMSENTPRSPITNPSTTVLPERNKLVNLPTQMEGVTQPVLPQRTSIQMTVSSVQSLPAQQTKPLQYNTLGPVLVPMSEQMTVAQLPSQSLTAQMRPIQIAPSAPLQSTPVLADANAVPFVHVGTIKTNSGGYFLLMPLTHHKEINEGALQIPTNFTTKTSQVTLPAAQNPSPMNSLVEFTGKHQCTQSEASTSKVVEGMEQSEQTKASPLLEKALLSSPEPMATRKCIKAAEWAKFFVGSQQDFSIMQMDTTHGRWTVNRRLVLTELYLPCKRPVYWSVAPPKTRVRITFPEEERDGTYNPLATNIDEHSANDDTPFGEWVKRIIQRNASEAADERSASPATKITESEANRTEKKGEEVRPVDGGTAQTFPRLKVKSFARLRVGCVQGAKAPERVCLQGKVYQKMGEDPLTYAQMLSVVPSRGQCKNLLTMKVPLFTTRRSGGKLVPLAPNIVHSLQTKNKTDYFDACNTADEFVE